MSSYKAIDIHVIVPQIVKRCGLFQNLEDHECQILRDWIGLAITDWDLLSSVIFLGTYRHMLRGDPHDPNLARMVLQYKQQGLQSLRHAVSGVKPVVNALTISKAVALALDEVNI